MKIHYAFFTASVLCLVLMFCLGWSYGMGAVLPLEIRPWVFVGTLTGGFLIFGFLGLVSWLVENIE